MNSKGKLRNELIRKVINEIECKFPDSIAVWTGSSVPDQEYDVQEVEVFEVYMIQESELPGFEDLVWNLQLKFGDPPKVTLMIYGLTPEVTVQFRKDSYDKEVKKRKARSTSVGKI
ncbi:MAG TPA: hypothetical protein VGB30_13710 [bacterium]|jgi:hypothetical protein